VLATLTVESINRDVYTIVELVSNANVHHCERASANEIIVNNHVTSGLLARAVLEHGITKAISEWLSVDPGNELYKIHVPTLMANRLFVDVLTLMKQQHDCIVLGIQSNKNNEVLSNPPTDYIVGKDDQLIVVCAERPNII
jgi:voltage-gated potassium channel